ncbi:hypothetical protein PF008_g30278 [Phytophthora fragariae]|uniref:Uncharacterized protein n=1 Tax=Phytophthora fragariae TaxID=53985 RepID=A0A6G0Q5Z6_9STRA|nr:hypothetical protein PF008_g30278 [Phytophthora fragariae]
MVLVLSLARPRPRSLSLWHHTLLCAHGILVCKNLICPGGIWSPWTGRSGKYRAGNTRTETATRQYASASRAYDAR